MEALILCRAKRGALLLYGGIITVCGTKGGTIMVWGTKVDTITVWGTKGGGAPLQCVITMLNSVNLFNIVIFGSTICVSFFAAVGNLLKGAAGKAVFVEGGEGAAKAKS